MKPPFPKPHEVLILVQVGEDKPVVVGTAATSADVPDLLRLIIRHWERREPSGDASSGSPAVRGSVGGGRARTCVSSSCSGASRGSSS